MLNRNGILDLLLYFSLIAFGKTPFPVLNYGVLFSSIAKIFASAWKVIIYHHFLSSQNFQRGLPCRFQGSSWS